LKVNDKYLCEESKYIHNFVKIYGLLNIITGLILIFLIFVMGIPGIFVLFLLVIPILLIIIGIYWFKLIRFQITEGYVQFPKKINGFTSPIQKPPLINEIPYFQNKLFLERIKELKISNEDTFGISKKIKLESPEWKFEEED